MRHVERGPVPEFMQSSEWQRLRDQWWYYNLEGGVAGTKQRFDLQGRLTEITGDAIRRELMRTFEQRCAFTELPTGDMDLHRFRPINDATDLGGKISFEYYWWLALEWENWYLADTHIINAQRTVFPVSGSRSEKPRGFRELPSPDHGLLLDPCRDWPAWHLQFLCDGTVLPLTKRGKMTIDILNLNNERFTVVRHRIGVTIQKLKLYDNLGPEVIYEALLKTLANDDLGVRYPLETGFIRQMIIGEVFRFLRKPRNEQLMYWFDDPLRLDPDELAAHFFATPEGWETWRELPQVIKKLFSDVTDHAQRVAPGILDQIQSGNPFRHPLESDMEWVREKQDREQSLSVSEESRAAFGTATDIWYERPISPPRTSHPMSTEVPSTALVKRIIIRNFKAIHKADITIEEGGVKLQPMDESDDQEVLDGINWRVLLGENGSGKSSVIQAIGLALMGDRLFDAEFTHRRKDFWGRLLRHGSRKATVELQFVGDYRLRLTFTAKNGPKFAGVVSGPRINAFVRGYGATRLTVDDVMAEPTQISDSLSKRVRVDGLYNPIAPVGDPKSWLLRLDDWSFNVAAVTLGDLLQLSSNEVTQTIHRDQDSQDILIDGVPLAQVSDGYRSVIALACDLMAGMAESFSDVRRGTGIVLIDEIGAHLHPRWKMTIVGKLRRAFPSMQFICSTHEPLCLRGLESNEVALVEKHKGEVRIENIERSPSSLRVDQLLTSEFFGLMSTIDPRIDRKFQEYYALLALPERDDQQERRRIELQAELQYHGQLGYTRRDQIVYDLIDRFLAQEFILPLSERREMKNELRRRVREIWTFVNAGQSNDQEGGA